MPGIAQAFTQGTEAGKPAAVASTNQGYFYYATDTGKLWQSWNSAWVQVAAGTSLSSSDIPSLDASKFTTGLLATARLGNVVVPQGCTAMGSLATTSPSAVTSALLATSGGTSFSDVTAALTGLTPGATINFGATNDALYIGSTSAGTGKFGKLAVSRATTAVWSLATSLEYYNGSIWTTPPASCGLGDQSASGGASFSAAASAPLISFLPPSDWATTAVNGTTAYWWRCRVTSFTSKTTAPQYFGALLTRLSDITAGGNPICTTGTITRVFGTNVTGTNYGFINLTAGTISAPMVNSNGSLTGIALPVTAGDLWTMGFCNSTSAQFVVGSQDNQFTLYIQC